MKLCSFLISFAFLNVSSYTTKMEYTKDVAITNAHIRLASIMNNFTIRDKVVLNGLEHVIKTIIAKRQNYLERINNMFTVPEYLPPNTDWCALKVFQKDLQEVIKLELDIPVPEVPDENIPVALIPGENIPVPEVPDENFIKLDLNELGAKRRELTRIALINILKRTINCGKPEKVTHLIAKRSHLGTDTFEKRISHTLAGPEKEISLQCMYILIALFMSTKYPESHITYIQKNSDGTCTLKDDYFEEEFKTYKTYGIIEGQWCQLIDNEVQPLKELL
ncbi:uncharacterized protein LOC126835194 isoform X2 [Adelges cooleyi]|uniref:uncharacterized protein LOC126835194 isoform X2 n=1 Tax=Adelges cooleyi TaxID=133065 RepID=UPI0021801227|nr:uncharacterized protein LOC126835194 isoform X2 [Adelges cooleyi]XP_050423528.1 uncharacterized protein LOC126835194 isoform X2 [Adelges cooleyi]